MIETPKPRKTTLTRSRTLAITLSALVIVYLLWNVAQLSFLLYPFRLFVTYVHESGHVLMTLLTGGKVVGFSVAANGSGVATRIGGTASLILPAGYLGAAFFGAILFYLLNRLPYARTIAMLLGAMLVVFTVLYARPGDGGVPMAIFVGLMTGAGLFAMGWKLNREINLLVLNVLAIMVALNGVFDLVWLVNNADATLTTKSGVVRNDAAAFAKVAGGVIPASVWAFLWALIAIAMLGAAVYYSILRPMMKDVDRLVTKKKQDMS